MTKFQNLTRITAEFVNRDGIPTRLVAYDLPDDAYAEVSVSGDGLSADVLCYAGDIQNNGEHWKFESMEDKSSVALQDEDGQTTNDQPVLGAAGKVVTGVVALAILTPFIGILWAWALGVVRTMGGLW